jgi:hypothetical protein
MQFYPNNIPSNQVGFAVSASIAKTGSLIANFSAISVTTVNTASLALNITGTPGTNGTGASLSGPKGPQGPRGVTGPRGNSVYLLSSSWHDATQPGASCDTPVPTNCWEVKLYSSYETFGQYTCDFSINAFNPTTYYTTTGASQVDVNANFGADFPLYTNNTCTDTLASALSGFVTFPAVVGAHLENGQNTVYSVTSLSSSSIAGTCGGGV